MPVGIELCIRGIFLPVSVLVSVFPPMFFYRARMRCIEIGGFPRGGGRVEDLIGRAAPGRLLAGFLKMFAAHTVCRRSGAMLLRRMRAFVPVERS